MCPPVPYQAERPIMDQDRVASSATIQTLVGGSVRPHAYKLVSSKVIPIGPGFLASIKDGIMSRNSRQ